MFFENSAKEFFQKLKIIYSDCLKAACRIVEDNCAPISAALASFWVLRMNGKRIIFK